MKKEYPYNLIDYIRKVKGIDEEYPEDIEETFNYLMDIMDSRERIIIEHLWRDRMTKVAISKIIDRSCARVGQLERKAYRFLNIHCDYIRYGLKHIKDSESEGITENLDITELELPAHAYNCLRRYGYKTIKEVVDSYNKHDLQGVDGIGKNTYNEIESQLFRLGFINETKPADFTITKRIREMDISTDSKHKLYNHDIYHVNSIVEFIRSHNNDCLCIRNIGINDSDYSRIIKILKKRGYEINIGILSE